MSALRSCVKMLNVDHYSRKYFRATCKPTLSFGTFAPGSTPLSTRIDMTKRALHSGTSSDTLVHPKRRRSNRVRYHGGTLSRSAAIDLISNAVQYSITRPGSVRLHRQPHEIYDNVSMHDFLRLLDELDVTGIHGFVDIGSGTGNLVMLVAIASTISHCVGIEIVQERHNIAVRAKESLLAQGVAEIEKISFVAGDLSDEANKSLFANAGLVFANNLRFKPETDELVKSMLAENSCIKYLAVTKRFFPRKSHSRPDIFTEAFEIVREVKLSGDVVDYACTVYKRHTT
ncbi:Histone-lysine N-methyltransferase, H3 lysine-79 specific [Aphanomyces cochlioides]|nr:Histone-lysine N-methyltransferase, H3 lysine-79 specific [Aphanomyces cochlioides]